MRAVLRLSLHPGSVERVLIYRLGSLGDTVVALPCYHQVARSFPNAKRYLLTNLPVSEKAPSAREILGESGLIDGYMDYPVGLRSVGEVYKVWRQIRALSPEVLIYLAAPRGLRQARRDALFFRACGIKKLVGVPYTEDLQMNRWVEGRQSAEPEADRLARCVSELGAIDLNDERNWDLALTQDEHSVAAERLEALKGRPFVAVSVGTKMQSKDWGVENWGSVLARIAVEYRDYGLVLVGAGSESNASEIAARRWGAGAMNLCGELTPRQTAAVLQRARLFVGHDSGPMHLAAAVQTPCVAVFAALRKPGIWFPYGSRHRVIYHDVNCANCGLSICIEQRKKCITSITIEEVMLEIRKQLDGTPKPN